MVKRWFYNYGGKQNQKDKVTYVRKWNLKQVVGFLKKVEIQDICQTETQCLPGTKHYIGGYQKALTTVVEGLSKLEKARLHGLAKEWTKKKPPPEVQQR